mgnify:CR=1 FL=1
MKKIFKKLLKKQLKKEEIAFQSINKEIKSSYNKLLKEFKAIETKDSDVDKLSSNLKLFYRNNRNIYNKISRIKCANLLNAFFVFSLEHELSKKKTEILLEVKRIMEAN